MTISTNLGSMLATALAVMTTTGVLTVAVPVFGNSGTAHAAVGLPWTPVSAAGAARRTAVRRSTIYVATLPPSCIRTTISGVSVWKCNSTYYQAYGNRYVVVYLR